MGIVLDRNIPILKSKADLRRGDIIRGMCKHVSNRVKVEQAVNSAFGGQEPKDKQR